MKTVPLGGKNAAGRVALVDDEDFDLVQGYSWYRNANGHGGFYARAYIRGSLKNGPPAKYVYMHHLIAGRGADHVNRDGLDNQRANLRAASASQQGANQGPRAGTSRFKGVCWDRRERKWRAEIKVSYRRHDLGRFRAEEDAARAYDAAAVAQWGEFARVNFPEA